MKTLKIITIIIIILFSMSCDMINELFESDDPAGTGSIVGNWAESGATVSLVLTTKSNQTANNFLNSTGEISVMGDVKAKLPLMIEMLPEEANDDPLLIITNTSGFLGYTDTTYILLLNGNGTSTEAALMVSDTTDFYAEFVSEQANYTYNGTNLAVSSSTLQENDHQMSATISGTIASQQVNISANSPTTLSFNASHFYEFGSTVTTFDEDGSFISSEDTGLGDDTGNWEIVGDTLKITAQQEVEDPITGEITYVDTTWAFNYVNNGNKITLSQTIDICDLEDEDMSCADMYESIELLFGLDASSIIGAQLIYQLFFERTNDTALIKLNADNYNSKARPGQTILKFLLDTKRSVELNK